MGSRVRWSLHCPVVDSHTSLLGTVSYFMVYGYLMWPGSETAVCEYCNATMLMDNLRVHQVLK